MCSRETERNRQPKTQEVYNAIDMAKCQKKSNIKLQPWQNDRNHMRQSRCAKSCACIEYVCDPTKINTYIMSNTQRAFSI